MGGGLAQQINMQSVHYDGVGEMEFKALKHLYMY